MKRTTAPAVPHGAAVASLLLVALLGTALHLAFVLEHQSLSQAYFGTSWWQLVVNFLGGEIRPLGGTLVATVPLTGPLMCCVFSFGICWLCSAWRTRQSLSSTWFAAAMISGSRIGSWGQWTAGWGVLWLTASLQNWSGLLQLLALTEALVLPLTLAGCLHCLLWVPLPLLEAKPLNSTAADPGVNQKSVFPPWLILTALIATYSFVFILMNWGLWFNLRVPHGDSAMYEEHLWNITHGKGYRSYLDQGLFLGEHFQFSHLFLIPLYLLWPSHLLLECCQSVALAAAIIPLYRMTVRHSGSPAAGYLLSAAYLCWFGVHYSDISIDLKTFRPESFGIPLMFCWIDALESAHWKRSLVLLLLVLSCKEDYAIVTAPIGLWLAMHAWFTAPQGPDRRFRIVFGITQAALLTLYLLLVVKFLIPWFRHGETVHYAAYFRELGTTPAEIIRTILFHPMRTLGLFITLGSTLYLLYLLVPLAGLPLRSPGRLLTGLPLFLTLCLNELIKTTPGPFHHFHGPLIPIIFWSAAAGLGTLAPRWISFWDRLWGLAGLSINWETTQLPVRRAGLALCCSLATATVFSIAPLGLQFWDADRGFYWQTLYIPGERAQQFEEIAAIIPTTARVAATDFVHPRFTHYERSYDYSDYLRAVANYEDKVPEDTDYIILDTQHPYSRIRRLNDPQNPIRELVREPENWDILPDTTNGYFIVLKRKSTGSHSGAAAHSGTAD